MIHKRGKSIRVLFRVKLGESFFSVRALTAADTSSFQVIISFAARTTFLHKCDVRDWKCHIYWLLWEKKLTFFFFFFSDPSFNVLQPIAGPKSSELDMKQPTGSTSTVMRFQWTCCVRGLLISHKSTRRTLRCDHWAAVSIAHSRC